MMGVSESFARFLELLFLSHSGSRLSPYISICLYFSLSLNLHLLSETKPVKYCPVVNRGRYWYSAVSPDLALICR